MATDLISRDPGILGGTAVFAGSRVPVKTLMDYVEAGETLDAFLDDFPSVTRLQALLGEDRLEHGRHRRALLGRGVRQGVARRV